MNQNHLQLNCWSTYSELVKDKGWTESTGNDICLELCQFEDAPWNEVNNGKPITPNKLARMLKPFKVKPRQTWSTNTGKNRRLYQIKDVEQAYAPYNPSTSDRSDRSDRPL